MVDWSGSPDMRYVRSPIPRPGSARIGLELVSLLVATALAMTWGSDRSPAKDHSGALPSNALAEQSRGLKSQSSVAASRRARSRRATSLRATTGCNSKREPFVRFRWIPARKRGRAQRVDYTEFFRGLSSRQFHKSRKLAPRKQRWRTGRIETGLDYDWRVMTRRAHRWVSSGVHTFDAPVCVQSTAARP
jgi:hypothetical protein